MYLFCICIDPILCELGDTYGFKYVAYADDSIFALHSMAEKLLLINVTTDLFKKIGLTINVTKCKFTMEGEVKFMGITFFNNITTGMPAIESLANTIRDKCEENIEKYRLMLKAGVPKHIIFNFMKYCLIPSTNYGPFLDCIESKDTYMDID